MAATLYRTGTLPKVRRDPTNTFYREVILRPELHWRSVEASVKERPAGTRLAGWKLHHWQLAGFFSSVVMALSGTRVGNLPLDGQGHWWFAVPGVFSGIPGTIFAWVVFYAGLAGLSFSWWKLKAFADRQELDSRQSLLTLVAWAAPLILGPPLFSGDIYSYIAQGTLAQEGLNPYQMGPAALAPGPLLSSVAPVWMYTTAPYGPLWITIARAVATVFGGSVPASAVAMRAVELGGPLLMLRFLPRLASRMGANPSIALWLAVLSPLSMISFLASGHNDSLMVGLTVAAVTLCLEGRYLAAVILAGLATTIKVPGLAGVVFVVLAWAATKPNRSERIRLAVSAGAVAAGVLAVVTEVSGLGWGWLGPSTLGTPTLVTIPSAPMVAFGMTIGNALGILGLPLSTSTAVTIFQGIGALGAVAVGVLTLFRAKGNTIPVALAAAFAGVVLLGPVLWPWYLMWSLALLAATRAQNSRLLTAACFSGAVLLLPDGSSTAVGPTYLVVSALAIYVAFWTIRSGHWRELLPGLFGTIEAEQASFSRLADGAML